MGHAGVSNMVTACVGAGLTGSYIFSQTVFSLRGGVTSRLQGFVIAGAHPYPVIDFHAPFPLIAMGLAWDESSRLQCTGCVGA